MNRLSRVTYSGLKTAVPAKLLASAASLRVIAVNKTNGLFTHRILQSYNSVEKDTSWESDSSSADTSLLYKRYIFYIVCTFVYACFRQNMWNLFCLSLTQLSFTAILMSMFILLVCFSCSQGFFLYLCIFALFAMSLYLILFVLLWEAVQMVVVRK
jgi:hypothetical protein